MENILMSRLTLEVILVSCCLVLPSVDGNLDIICQSTNDSRGNAIPNFPNEFEAHMEVTDLVHNFTAEVSEYVRHRGSAVYRTSRGTSVTCLYDDTTKIGYVINGIRCNRGSDLPHQCFCNQTCQPFIPLRDVFAYMKQYNAVMTSEGLNVRGIPVRQWSVRCWSNRNPNITLAIDLYLTRKHYMMARSAANVPVRVSIYSRGDLLKILDPNVRNLQLVLEITHFKPDVQQNDVFHAPPGVFCPSHGYYRPFPNLSDQFSVTMETVLKDRNVVIYINHFYDFKEKLVAYELRPNHPSATSSLARLYKISKTPRFYRIIHDFQSGVQYMIDEQSGNCTTTAIPMDAYDAIPLDDTHVRLRHANELLAADRTSFTYYGQRTIRGIPCEVWIAEKPLSSDSSKYSTIEIYFTLDNWTVEVEMLNKEKQVPLGISIYEADSPLADRFSDVKHTYYYGYNLGHPDWGNFDISICLARVERIYLILTLQVEYAQLAKHNMGLAENSIRRGIAGIAGVSPLRITNMFVGRSQEQEVDVWFVLLERPEVVGNVPNPRPQMLMTDAYRLLQNFIENSDADITIDVAPKEQRRIQIKRSSLERTSESLHPNTRHKSLRYLKAGYTAGSMAGLGFSMAILGTCVGVFVGFLLWKKGTGIPYHIHH